MNVAATNDYINKHKERKTEINGCDEFLHSHKDISMIALSNLIALQSLISFRCKGYKDD